MKSLEIFLIEQGVSIIEVLVSLTVLLMSMLGTASLFIADMHLTSAARRESILLSEIEHLVEGYRAMSFTALAQEIDGDTTHIKDGSSVTTERYSDSTFTQYVVQLVAIKSKSMGLPEGIRVRVTTSQRRGIFGEKVDTYETVISGVR